MSRDKFGSYIQRLMTTVMDKEQEEFVTDLAWNELKNINSKILKNENIFLGGPVDKSMFFLHKKNIISNESIKINNDLFFSKNIDYLHDLIKNNEIKKDQFKLFIGYSGWNKGQLQEELNENSWIVIPKFDSNIIFSKDYKNIWKKVLNNSNKIHKMFSNYPINPRLN